MRRYLFLALLLITLPATDALAEYAARFSSATVEPGEEFTIDLSVENDETIGGVSIPFRWSSAAVTLLDVEIIPDRLIGNVTWFVTATDQVKRTSGILIFNNRLQGWIEAGDGPVARLTFRANAGAGDQYVFVDSVYERAGDIVLLQVNFSNLDGSESIFPPTYPGVITIGNPAPATISVSPQALSFRGETAGLEPESRTIDVRSDGSIEFDWSADWSSDWLDVSPPIGKTPALPTVNADAFFLLPGVYYDTIVVSSPIAENSPVVIPVLFTVDTAGARPPDGYNFTLGQNRPSPFVAYRVSETWIPFLLEEADLVEIAIYNILGRRIKTLTAGQYAEGEASVVWDGRDSDGEDVASGHYLCRMATSTGELSRVIVLIR